MRMNSLRRSSSGSRALGYILGFVVSVGLLYFFATPIGVVSGYILSPLHALKIAVVEFASPLSSFFSSRRALESEIATLKESLKNSEYDAARLSVLEKDTAFLQNEQSGEKNRIVARVVRHPNETPYDTLLLDKVSAEGVQERSFVYANRVAIGSVARVFLKSSLVVLFSTPDIETPVYVYGPDVFARAYGVGGGVLRVSVPQGIQLSVGDVVVTPFGSENIYGTIAYIESSPSNPEQFGFVVQNEALSGLQMVAIEKESAPALSYEEAVMVVDEVRTQFATSTLGMLMTDLPLASSTASSTNP